MGEHVRTLCRIAPLTVLLICSPPASALSPPLVTDDPETPGAGGWEINILSTIERTRDETFIEAPLLDINYGFLENDQLKLEVAVASVDARDDVDRWGIGDLLIGYKYRFLEQESRLGWQTSFYPQLSCPTGNRGTGIGSGDIELQIPFQFAKHFLDDRLYVNPEVGYNVVAKGSGSNSWKYGLAVEWAWNKRLELLGEVGAFVFPGGTEPNNPFFNIGFEYNLTDHVALLASSGRSFRGGSSRTPEFTGLLGFEFTFGGTPEEADRN